jgi:hypothetical protein
MVHGRLSAANWACYYAFIGTMYGVHSTPNSQPFRFEKRIQSVRRI